MTFWSECIEDTADSSNCGGPSKSGREGYHRYKSEQFRTLIAKRRPSMQRSKGSTISVISAHPLRSLDPLRFEHSPSFLAFWAQKCFPRRCARPPPRPISVPRFIRSRHRRPKSQASYFPLCCCSMPHPRSPTGPFIEEVLTEGEGVVPKADSA